MAEGSSIPENKQDHRSDLPLMGWVALALILALGAYFRFSGLNWDESQHLHPDERFLTMVETSLTPVKSLGDYFNTAQSTLNPHNVGFSFFVYGTLPIFAVRYIAEALGQTSYDQVFLVGRAASAAVDLVSVVLVFLVAQALFGRRWLSLISAGFYAFAVLPIQLSHFFAVDTFANAFGLAAIYFAILILRSRPVTSQTSAGAAPRGWEWIFRDWKSTVPYLLFGLFYGLALASKINIAPMAVLLPGAAAFAWSRLSPRERLWHWPVIARNLVLAGFLAFLIFRIGQPYAFQGPGFLGIAPNQKWIDNLKGLMVQSSGDGDSPPELQWARRPASFAWTNMVEWGLGLPLGLLATAGLAWMGWKILRRRWREYGLLWGWTAAYFCWQGLSFTRTMRYEIPVYPLFIIMAAWLLDELWRLRTGWADRPGSWIAQVPWGKVLAGSLAAGTLAATLAWAFAFTRIYNRPMTRVEASRWIYQNIPAPINVQVQTGQGEIRNMPLSYPTGVVITPANGVQLPFTAQDTGTVYAIQLEKFNISTGQGVVAQLGVELYSLDEGTQILAKGGLSFRASEQDQPTALSFDHPAEIKKGQRYSLKIEVSGENSILALTGSLFLKSAENYHSIRLDPDNPVIQSGKPFSSPFFSPDPGTLSQLALPIQVSQSAVPLQVPVSVTLIESGAVLVANANEVIALVPGMPAPVIRFDPPVKIYPGIGYILTVEVINAETPIKIQGQLQIDLMDGIQDWPLPAPAHLIPAGIPYLTPITVQDTGLIKGVLLARAAQQYSADNQADTLTATISDTLSGQILGETKVTTNLFPANDPRGSQVQFTFDPPVAVKQDQTYFVQLAVDRGAVALRGSAPANESTWDDGLPLRVDGLDGYNGFYDGGLNFEMYWDDDAAKLERFTSTLDQADTIFISSNRQWGTTTRIQERYPLTTEYYRDLVGCPAEQSIIACYSTAHPGMYQGKLGFDLVKVFQSEPSLGGWQFNSQFAEEAFTVYDHPKVMIFQKRSDYSSQQVRTLLGMVDLSKVVAVTPRKAGVPGNLMLPSEKLSQQQEGGTWADLFDRESILNRWPAVGAVIWYLFLFLLGIMVYPFVRLALGGLSDRGYPLARLIGMVLLAFLVWFGGSNGLPFTQTMIWLVLAGLLAANLALFLLQRTEIVNEFKSRPKYYLMIEGLFLAFFILDLLIRLGNPDLWHPAKGGEKPMDFSYLNAVIKSTSFPPYDPWFAGGYINYYYYGFVLVGVLIKALGIIPAAAYNLVLPTLFAMVALGAFSVGWNLLSRRQTDADGEPDIKSNGIERIPLFAGLAAAVGLLILGNLGTINMIWEGFQLTVVSREVMEKADFFTRMGWTVQGVFNYFRGMPLPFNIGEWYWNPSRAIPGEPITEFPFFTFLYADLHAHMIALPVTVLAISWGLNIVHGRWQWGVVNRGEIWAWLQFGLTFALGGLAIGALRPTNTWDMPVYLVLGALAVLYTALRYSPAPQRIVRLADNIYRFFAEMDGDEGEKSVASSKWTRWVLKIGTIALPSILLLAGLSFVLYQPFADWFGQAYTSMEAWMGDHTPMWAYRLHWGVFLFIIASWMVWESVDWMAKTPLSALNKLRPYIGFIGTAIVGLVGLVIYLTINKVQIAWIPLIFGAWALILIFRPGQSDAKRAVLFMTGTALALTLAVELIVLRGDLGRMNTVFKFYMQAWTLFALSAAAAITWLLPAILQWRSNWSNAWQVAAVTLVGCAALFPLLAGQAKIEDRMAQNAPHTLDGMAYMQYSQYSDQNMDMDLSEDARAIQWMQDHVPGSPVIVEANTPEYRWGTRFTIYTGLPGVVGWSWHQRGQQRALTPSEWVTDRIDQIGTFYSTSSESFTMDFLRQYNVKYIIVGQLERAYYAEDGLAKFDQWNGKYWKEVYREGQTVIYAVLQ